MEVPEITFLHADVSQPQTAKAYLHLRFSGEGGSIMGIPMVVTQGEWGTHVSALRSEGHAWTDLVSHLSWDSDGGSDAVCQAFSDAVRVAVAYLIGATLYPKAPGVWEEWASAMLLYQPPAIEVHGPSSLEDLGLTRKKED